MGFPHRHVKGSGHKTEAMFKHYADIVPEEETAAALLQAESYLRTQPTDRNLSEIPAMAVGRTVVGAREFDGKSGSSGRIRTYNPPVNSRMLYP
jgi:hypothetical protein